MAYTIQPNTAINLSLDYIENIERMHKENDSPVGYDTFGEQLVANIFFRSQY